MYPYQRWQNDYIFGPALPVVPFPGPARPVIQILILGPFGPAKIYSVQCSKLRLLTTQYLTDLYRIQFNVDQRICCFDCSPRTHINSNTPVVQVPTSIDQKCQPGRNFRPGPQMFLFSPTRPGPKLIYYKICTMV